MLVVPSSVLRAVLGDIRPRLGPKARVAWASKGFELASTRLGNLRASGYALVRYLDQLPEDQTFVDHLGRTQIVDTRRDIQFHSRVTAAHWHEATRSWKVTLDDGSRHTARFLITAIGVLSTPTLPRFDGIETFKGQSFHTARWPHEPVDFTGKRVAVIGTGATGV